MLSLCMIVKDEALMLEQAIASVKDIVTDMVVVDTGSKDPTINIAKNLGARVIEEPFKGDFAKARNRAIGAVTTPWILFLDADEKILEQDTRLILAGIRQSHAPYGYWLKRYNYLGTGGWRLSKLLRLFRKHDSVHYEGKVWEKIVIPDFSANTSALDIKIHHYGECRGDSLENRARTYIDLCHEERKKQSRAFLYALEADRYLILGQAEKGLDVCMAGAVAFPEDYWIYYVQASLYHALEQKIEAMDALQKGLRICAIKNPSNQHFFDNRLGLYIFLEKRFEEARMYFLRARQNNDKVSHLYLNLGLCYERLGQTREAIDALHQAIKLNPNLELEHLDFGADYHRRNRDRSDVIPEYQGVFQHLSQCYKTMRQAKEAETYRAKADQIIKKSI